MRALLRNLRDAWTVLRGAIAYSRTGVTPAPAFQSMISLYCRTSGTSNDLLHSAIRVRRRPYSLGRTAGVLGDLSPDVTRSIVNAIQRDGYYVFPTRLSRSEERRV